MWSSWVQGSSDGPLVPMVRLVPMECISLRELDYFLMWSGWVQGNSNCPSVPMVRLVPIENDVIPMVLLVNGSFENEALENEDRSTKHPKLETTVG